ncbi:MAG TPA: acyl transferase, partial [Saprospiraceae bacterium]|nr:acyl transferase [Saprospiraceae bacterium]
ELFSQAYLQDDGWFKPGYSMRVFTTEINDPYARERCGKTGIINVIDLANVETCSFITTEDLGIVREDGCFKVLGRLDHSDRRGCNLMIE